LTIIKEVGEVGGLGREMGLGISIYNFLRSNKLGRRKCTASWLSLASFGHLPLSQFVNYCKMNFFTDDHAGTETLRPWYCTGHYDCDLAKQQLPFPGQFAMGWYGMDAFDSDDNVFSTRTSAAPPHPPVDPSLSMSPLSAAG